MNQSIRFIQHMPALAALLLCMSPAAWACTSVIVSGKATTSGRPLMLKHRDTDDQQNSVQLFSGERYSFIGLVNSCSPPGEVWTGTNDAGFSIMNTASYNFREDSLDITMDREGELMYKALSLCATVEDFEVLLDSCLKPLGVEANFGVIDAHGGAAYYEVNNFRWVKYDVNAIACGYRVVTNFCEAGRREDYQGWDRYLIASDVMAEEFAPDVDHRFFFERLSRNTTERNGHRIPRNITSASIVIEGVQPDSDPLATVMWTILGDPLTHIAEPLTLHRVRQMRLTDAALRHKAPHCLRSPHHNKLCRGPLRKGERVKTTNEPRTVARIRRDGLTRQHNLNRQKEERLRKKFLRRHSTVKPLNR